jgi:membrane fusion protein, epimerase transport system
MDKRMTPAEMQSIAALEPPPPANASARGPIIVGILIILLFFGGFGAWAVLSPLNGAVVGEGVVSVEGNRKSVDHLEGGIVRELHVRDGDEVSVGDVLMVLDDGRPQAQVSILAQQVAVARATEARLLAERAGAAEVTFPDNLVASDLPYVSEAMASEREAFAARRESLLGSQEVLGHRIEDLNEQIAGQELRLASIDEQLTSMEGEKATLDALFAQGLSTNERVLQLERSITGLRSQRSDAATAIASARVNIAENEQQIRQLTYERRTQIATDLAAVQQRLLDLGPSLDTAEAALERVVVRSPYDGLVVGLSVFSVGEVVPAGATLLEIVPRQTSLVISTRFRVEDIADLQVGSAAEVHFTSMTRLYVPVLHGRVALISADRLTDDRTGVNYYRGEVVIDGAELAANPAVQLYPGMPATVMVTTQTRSALEYLLGPIVAAFDSAFRQG